MCPRSSFLCFLLVYKVATDLCKLILYFATLVFFCYLYYFQVEFLRSLMYSIMPSANRESLIPFHICIPLISFF